ncbi:hypothetical protein [Alienimonas sp. DA493]|uniref:hypothetical protein n=1 Tax=Alienimonas sp. DA493 TaxID=3373605 RepID=UPI0037551A35
MPAARSLLILCLTAGLAASGGCKEKDEIPPEVDAALNQNGPADAPAPPAEKKTGIVGRKTIEVLDAPAVIAAGTHTISQDKIGEGDPMGNVEYGGPITGPLNALGGATGFVGRLPMHQWVQGEYALKGRYPTYEEFTAFLQKNKQYAMPMPRLSQRYGYDETRGAVVLLDVVGGIPDEGGSLDMDGDRLLPQTED